MRRKIALTITVLALVVWATSVCVYAEGPSFNPAIYADGRVFATKGLADLPPPNGHNNQSFDKLFSFVNGAAGQLPVAEAAPGNPEYNGGRWNLQLVTWISDPEVVTSYDEIQMHLAAQDLVIVSGNSYFECPLLPVKE